MIIYTRFKLKTQVLYKKNIFSYDIYPIAPVELIMVHIQHALCNREKRPFSREKSLKECDSQKIGRERERGGDNAPIYDAFECTFAKVGPASTTRVHHTARTQCAGPNVAIGHLY